MDQCKEILERRNAFCRQLVSRSICSCSQAVSKSVWYIPLLCVQWKNSDDGQKNCPKHVEFRSKIKFWEISASSWFYYKKYRHHHNLLNCPKPVEFRSKIKFWEISAASWFYYKKYRHHHNLLSLFYNSLTSYQNSTGLTVKLFLLTVLTKSLLTTWRVLIIAAFCFRI
jgi:hypothetical protein